MKEIEFDFLKQFEETMEQITQDVQGFVGPEKPYPSLEKLFEYAEIQHSQYISTKDKAKEQAYLNIQKDFICFAEMTASHLRIKEDGNHIIIELLSNYIYGGCGDDGEVGHLLSKFFGEYPDFTMDVVDGKYILIKFHIDLTVRIQVVDHSEKLEQLLEG